jgi:hypothetical protein
MQRQVYIANMANAGIQDNCRLVTLPVTETATMITLTPYPYVIAAAIGGALIWTLWMKRFCSHLGQSVVNESKKNGLASAEAPNDYFKLTDVPAPKPLPDFNVDNALPRPYRPFRWKYHQTMCM